MSDVQERVLYAQFPSRLYNYDIYHDYIYVNGSIENDQEMEFRPESKYMPKMLSGISQKFYLLCLFSIPIMLALSKLAIILIN